MKVMSEILFEKKSYTACINGECPQSAECLRYLYFQNLEDNPLHISVLNPIVARRQQDDCPHFKTSVPQHVAYGFIGILNSLPVSASRPFVDKLIATYGRKGYYQIRKGERFILKEDREIIIEVARSHGATHLEFDRYDDVIVY